MPRRAYAAVAALALAVSPACRTMKSQPPAARPAVPVSVAVAAKEPVPVEIRAIGTVEAFATVQVKSQVAGELLSVRFREGGSVSKGDLLFEIDPRPFREALRQAEAAAARDIAGQKQAEANLARDRAQLKNAEADAARYEELSRAGVVSRTQFELFQTSAEALREAVRGHQAAIESARASLEADRAAVERAKLDLGHCEIRAPISGRTGNLLVHAGNLVRASGDNPLVVINQIAPIFVSFGVPEQHLGAIRSRSAARRLPVEVSRQGESARTGRGTLEVIDNAVDASTGTIRLKAVFDNSASTLWPGEFVNVLLTLETRTDAVVVPAEAVQSGQQGQFVYVVKPDQKVELRPVTPGLTAGGKAVIEKGVAAGETVVTDGQLRLFPGAPIKAVPAAAIESKTL